VEYDWSKFRGIRKIKTVVVYEPYPKELIAAMHQSLIDIISMICIMFKETSSLSELVVKSRSKHQL
jgi:hypothetical protein